MSNEAIEQNPAVLNHLPEEPELVSGTDEPKKGVTVEREGDRKLVLHLNALGSDVYQVDDLGKIGVTVDLRHNGYYGLNQVILDCSDCTELQGSRQVMERRVQLNYNGYGSQQLGPTRLLVIDLGKRAIPRPVYGRLGYIEEAAPEDIWRWIR